MERSFYKRESTPVLRNIAVDGIDLYGKDYRTLVDSLSDAKIDRLTLAFWLEDECDREFLIEGNLGNETLNAECLIALRDPDPENYKDIGRTVIDLMKIFYRPKIQLALDMMHEDLREQIEAEEYIAEGYRQLVDENSGERRWVK